MIMVDVIDKSLIPPVDSWATEENPIDPKDVIFKNIKGEIILPISERLGRNSEEAKQLDYFAMNSKRSYNSDMIRDHICRYLNYFEKYYDFDKELIMVMHAIKVNIDYMRNYSKDNFMDDINRYIIRNPKIFRLVRRFVNDNYLMKLSNNGGKTPNLQFTNKHAKILYEISLMMNMYIPLATHYMYVHFIKKSPEVHDFMLELFDMCSYKYEVEENIDIYNKIYETSTSVVNKSRNPNKQLWDKNLIRGNNTTTHTKEAVNDIILNIIPKYVYDMNIINFNYYSNRKTIGYKITEISYEYVLVRLSSSERDADNNSAYDRYESRINKKDEALALQNKVAAEQSIYVIENQYGNFTSKEIEYYKSKLTKGGSGIINKLSNDLIGYLFYGSLGDPETWKNIPNVSHYVMMMLCAKKKLLEANYRILPYIISSKVTRTNSRKVINKSNTNEIKNAALWEDFRRKYNNEKIEQQFFDLLGSVKASKFEIIDWDEDNDCPGKYDGLQVPMIDDMIDEEMLSYAISI